MAVVAGRVVALRPTRGDVVLIHLGGVFVDAGGVGVAADAIVDVAGHVHDVPGLGHQLHQNIGCVLGTFRRRGGLNRVNIEVQRAGMFRRPLDHRLQGRDDLGAVALGLDAVLLPIVPGLGVHHRLGEEGRRIEVVRIVTPQLAHRPGEGLVHRMAVGLCRSGVAGIQGRDPGLFSLAGLGRQALGLLQRLPGWGDRVGRHRQVDVGAERKGHPPPAHGARRIQPRGLAERTDRLSVIEPEHQVHTLIEEFLRLRVAGGDRHVVRSQSLEHRRALLVGLAGIDGRHRRQWQSHAHGTGHLHPRHPVSGPVLGLRRDGGRHPDHERQDKSGSSHRKPPQMTRSNFSQLRKGQGHHQRRDTARPASARSLEPKSGHHRFHGRAGRRDGWTGPRNRR